MFLEVLVVHQGLVVVLQVVFLHLQVRRLESERMDLLFEDYPVLEELFAVVHLLFVPIDYQPLELSS